MKYLILCLCLVLALGVKNQIGNYVNTFTDEDGIILDHYKSEVALMGENKNMFEVHYDLLIRGDDSIRELDEMYELKEISGNVDCDADGKELSIMFHEPEKAGQFMNWVNSKNETFVTGGPMWECDCAEDQPEVMMRHLKSATVDNVWVVMETELAAYDDLIKDGEITVSLPDQINGKSHNVCVGFNVDDNCDAAAEPFQIYKNDIVDLMCSNCYLGAKATVFFDIKFGIFKLKKAEGGLKDIEANAAIILDLIANGKWTGKWEKTIPIVKKMTLVMFSIGPIPVHVWFDIPLELIGSFGVEAAAEATFGVTGKWDIGDLYIKYEKGFKPVYPDPHFTWDHVLEYHADLQATGQFGVIPHLRIHLAKILTVDGRLDPEIYALIEGNAEQREICTTLDYQFLIDLAADLDILVYQKHFGPLELFDTGRNNIGHWCLKW